MNDKSAIPDEALADDLAAPDLAAPDAVGPEGADRPPRRSKAKILWHEWVKPLAIIALAMFSFRSAVADWNDVPSGSMKPTILEGDRIFINKVAYDLKVPFTTYRIAQWDDPHWGDVVVLFSPEDGKRLVKRVIGLPGDVIQVRGDILTRNGLPAAYGPLDEKIAAQIPEVDRGEFVYNSETIDGRTHAVMSPLFRPPNRDWGPGEVPPDHYFLMGDNRYLSRDSRMIGPVHRSVIVGRAVGVAFSLDLDKGLPRWHRFFFELP